MDSPFSVLQLSIKEHFFNSQSQSSPLTLIMTHFSYNFYIVIYAIILQ